MARTLIGELLVLSGSVSVRILSDLSVMLCNNFLPGLDILSALVTLFFVHPLTHDGMEREDRAFREYLEEHGYDTSKMGLPNYSEETGSTEEEKSTEGEQRGISTLAKEDS